jgi:hypothetical protein
MAQHPKYFITEVSHQIDMAELGHSSYNFVQARLILRKELEPAIDAYLKERIAEVASELVMQPGNTNKKLVEALQEIALTTECSGPGCEFCGEGKPHPRTLQARIAVAALEEIGLSAASISAPERIAG